MSGADSDDALLVRARDGEKSAFDELIHKHRDYLRRLIDFQLDGQLVSRLDASDIVQETVMEAYKRIGNAESFPMSTKLWLRQLAIDRVRMAERKHLRTKKRGVGREVSLSARSSIWLAQRLSGQPLEAVLQSELIEAVRAAMEGLPVADREILCLRTFEDLSFSEIEQLTSVSAAAARKRYGRALIRLSQLLETFLSKED